MPRAARAQAVAGNDARVVHTALGPGGIRGVVALSGICDLDAVAALITGIDRLLATDTGEIWIDARDVVTMDAAVVAALLRSRIRAARFHVRVNLLPGTGAAREALLTANALEAFSVMQELPLELVRRAPKPAVRAAAALLAPVLRPASPAAALPARPLGVRLVNEDPDLAAGVPPERAAAASEAARAEVRTIRRGDWQPPEFSTGDLGLLILDGMLVRRVGSTAGAGAELLGPGDVVRPSMHPGEELSPWFTTTFRALGSVRVAVLDAAFVQRVAVFPTVLDALFDRLMQRSHALTVSMALAHYPRVDQRLLVLLQYLGQRWGRVTPRGIALRLPLTHAVLADLTASRRPSITLAFQHLERLGRLERTGDTVTLLEPPPRQDVAVFLAPA